MVKFLAYIQWLESHCWRQWYNNTLTISLWKGKAKQREEQTNKTGRWAKIWAIYFQLYHHCERSYRQHPACNRRYHGGSFEWITGIYLSVIPGFSAKFFKLSEYSTNCKWFKIILNVSVGFSKQVLTAPYSLCIFFPSILQKSRLETQNQSFIVSGIHQF